MALERFRQEAREKYISHFYSPWVHTLFIILFTVCGLVIYSQALEVRNPFFIIAVCLCSLLIANVVEYWAHRLPMHRPYKWLYFAFDHHTLRHHRFFPDTDMGYESGKDVAFVLFSPLMMVLFFLGFAAPICLAGGWLFGRDTGLLMMMTAHVYYFSYECLHFLYHLPEAHWLKETAFLRWLSAHHRIHHDPRYMGNSNFNVTLPLADWIFGTYRR